MIWNTFTKTKFVYDIEIYYISLSAGVKKKY